jgi:hypothetical protein
MTGVDMPRMSAILAAFALLSAGQALKPAVRVDPIDGIVEAFRTHHVVMLPGGHGSRPGYDLILAIAREPRIQGTVTDIVVEFGSSRYQDLIDRFVRGDAIADAALRHVWQDTAIAGVTPRTTESFILRARAASPIILGAARARPLSLEACQNGRACASWAGRRSR